MATNEEGLRMQYDIHRNPKGKSKRREEETRDMESDSPERKENGSRRRETCECSTTCIDREQ